MSEDLTPAFEAPEGGNADAGADEAEVSLYDLSAWVDEGDFILGFTGMLKVLREDGSMFAFHVGLGVNEFEAIGLHTKLLTQINEGLDMDSFWGDD